jgi:uncharacterized protein YoxC
MPPKTKPVEEEPTMTDLFKLLKGQTDQLTALTNKVSKIETDLKRVELIETEVKNIKTLVVSLTEENKELRQEIKKKDEQLDNMQTAVNDLEIKLNNLEQHHRGWSARVINVPISQEEESDPGVVIKKVYKLALLPILKRQSVRVNFRAYLQLTRGLK